MVFVICSVVVCGEEVGRWLSWPVIPGSARELQNCSKWPLRTGRSSAQKDLGGNEDPNCGNDQDTGLAEQC